MYFEHDVHCRFVSALVSLTCCSWEEGGVQPQLYADNLKCVSRDPDLLLNAARFTTGYVRLVGQEPAPSKCVFLKYFQGGLEGYEGVGSVPRGR